MPIIDIDATLDPSGGADSVSESYGVNTESAAVHYEIGGATTDLDVRIETRLADDLGWQDWADARLALANGDAEVFGVDIKNVSQLRARAVNNDGSNGADVRVVVET